MYSLLPRPRRPCDDGAPPRLRPGWARCPATTGQTHFLQHSCKERAAHFPALPSRGISRPYYPQRTPLGSPRRTPKSPCHNLHPNKSQRASTMISNSPRAPPHLVETDDAVIFDVLYPRSPVLSPCASFHPHPFRSGTQIKCCHCQAPKSVMLSPGISAPIVATEKFAR